MLLLSSFFSPLVLVLLLSHLFQVSFVTAEEVSRLQGYILCYERDEGAAPVLSEELIAELEREREQSTEEDSTEAQADTDTEQLNESLSHMLLSGTIGGSGGKAKTKGKGKGRGKNAKSDSESDKEKESEQGQTRRRSARLSTSGNSSTSSSASNSEDEGQQKKEEEEEEVEGEKFERPARGTPGKRKREATASVKTAKDDTKTEAAARSRPKRRLR